MICPTCKSKGFAVSVLGPDRCTFCDGTEGGNPPTTDEIAAARDRGCRHGVAWDVHCCHCHSGFIFDTDHVCPEKADA